MNEVESFVEQMGYAWGHRWESVESALRGVDDATASHQAHCYAAEEREEGWPLPGTILWQLAHLAHTKRYYRKLLAARGTASRPAADPRPAGAGGLAAERAALEEAHRAQVAGIARLRVEELDDRVPSGMTVREFLSHQVRHDTWHAAQIAVARRLHRVGGGAPAS
jgi:uncharacterized damage-inducible protein DinB